MDPQIQNILIWCLIGAIAGWLAGLVVRGFGFGLIGNIIVGIVGAVVGGWLFGQLGISIGSGLINAIVGATIGAIIVLFVVRLLKRA
ncbi:MAG: GlsB/YeaQ/YmgE family stress response membrane protein [Hyphomonadaceae bacterium]